MLNFLLIAIFALCVGFIFNEGLWGAGIMFCNVLMAAVLATNLFEPVAGWLESMMSGYTYFCDFLGLWICFTVFLLIFRLATDLLSRHRMRFKRPVDVAGGVVFASWHRLADGAIHPVFVSHRPAGTQFFRISRTPGNPHVFWARAGSKLAGFHALA